MGGNPSLVFNAANNRITSPGYSYDLAGNLTAEPDAFGSLKHSYAYDAENHIKTVGGAASYVYDGEGQRVRKLQGENLLLMYGMDGELLAEFDPVSGDLKKEYIYGASGLAATIASGEGTRYVTADHLGSPRILTSASGGVISRHDYEPFGEELFAGMGDRTTAQGYSKPDDTLRQKFTGKERDNETGLDYFLARYYSSVQGRFTSPDEFTGGPVELYHFVADASDNPTIYADLTNPQSLNKYQYVYNNPLNVVDPGGHCPICVGIAIGVTVAIELLTAPDTVDAHRPGDAYHPSGDGVNSLLGNATVGAASGAVVSKAGSSFLGKLFAESIDNAASGATTRSVVEAGQTSKPLLIGETMSRVGTVAEREGADVFTPSAAATTRGLVRAENSKVIDEALRDGRPILDIGTDAQRASASQEWKREIRRIHKAGRVRVEYKAPEMINGQTVRFYQWVDPE